jgi:hypothetical protein
MTVMPERIRLRIPNMGRAVLVVRTRPSRPRSPTLLPDPNPDGVRSRFDPDAGIVYSTIGIPITCC